MQAIRILTGNVRRWVDGALLTRAARRRRHRRAAAGTALVCTVVALVAATVTGTSPFADASTPGPLNLAWDRAQSAGSYHFRSDVEQITTPAATVANAGRTSRSEQFYLEGDADVARSAMEFKLWANGGSVLAGTESLAVRVADGATFQQVDGGEWQESSTFTESLAPSGDFMSYLAAARDVTDAGVEIRAGVTYTRYTFRVDGPAFADSVAEQVRDALAQRGELPAGAQLAPSAYYRAMTGDGELWVDAQGLPHRQTLTLQFPEQNGESATANITVDFSAFGESSIAAATSSGIGPFADWRGALPDALRVAAVIALVLALLGLGARRYAWKPLPTTGLSLALAMSFVVSSLSVSASASAHSSGADFAEQQRARAASQAEEHNQSEQAHALAQAQEDALADPREDRLAPLRASGVLRQLSDPAPALENDGTDTDGDGLTDFVEVSIGTFPEHADSDGDGIDDGVEVRGFNLSGDDVPWFTDPRAADSNGDGIGDAVEWDPNGDGQPDNTDADGVPDLFDDDNDNDGVPDRLDLAPFSAVDSFTNDDPLQLQIDAAAGSDIPVTVDFQVRPGADEHLTFALNPMDWPSDDGGQVRDVDDSVDDLQLVPMLEIRLPGDHALPSDEMLEAYAINRTTVGGGTGEQVVYVPLRLVTDPKTGERVAFSGQMLYASGSTWSGAHSVRMVWTVRMRNDVPCATPGESGCSTTGYRLNEQQVVHRYYESWELTGLKVTEEHGASIATIYEDPTLHPVGDEVPTWALAEVMNQQFLAAPADPANPTNGRYEVTSDDIAETFDVDQNGGAAELPSRVPNVFQVEQVNAATFAEGINETAGVTAEVLDGTFGDLWAADKGIMPKLMTASSSATRTLTTDALVTGSTDVRISGNAISIDLAVSSVPITTIGSVKWTTFCGGTGQSADWNQCSAEAVWLDLEEKFGGELLDQELLSPGSAPDADTEKGQNTLMQLYQLTMSQGVSAVLQTEVPGSGTVEIPISDVSDLSEIRTYIAIATGVGASVKFVANLKYYSILENADSNVKAIGKLDPLSTLKSGGKAALKDLINTTDSISASRRAVGAVAGVALVGALAGLVTVLYFTADGSSEAAITLTSLVLAVSVVAGAVIPAITLTRAVSAGLTNNTSLLLLRSEVVGATAKATAVGTAVVLVLTWAFAIAELSSLEAGSSAFNRTLATTLASTIYTVLLALISLTAVGLILVGILGAVDAILTLICQTDTDKPDDEGCFTIGGAVVEGIAGAIYDEAPLVDLANEDLVSTGQPVFGLFDAAAGYSVGNRLNVAVPVDTELKAALPSQGGADASYPEFYSQERLRSSTFTYTLTSPEPVAPTFDNTDEWTVEESGVTSYVGGFFDTSAVQGYEAFRTDVVTVAEGIAFEQAGINQPFEYHLNAEYDVPAFECWLWACTSERIDGEFTSSFDPLEFDIFPATLADFTAIEARDGGFGLAWETSFAPLDDADADGSNGVHVGGVDPDDNSWDSDGDGLSDLFELDQRTLGVALSPIRADTDGDTLTDAQELRLGTNPLSRDTDNDGLDDNIEVRHLVFERDASTGTMVPTGAVEGGWWVVLSDDSPPTDPAGVWVSSDPLTIDGDGDGVNDKAERQLSESAESRFDENGRAFHPNIANVAPLSIVLTVDDADGFVTPGQAVNVTSTVETTTRVEPSVLDLALPYGAPTPPALLPFDPDTFDGSQSVSNENSFSVPTDRVSETVSVDADVRARTTPTEAPDPAAMVVANGVPLDGVPGNPFGQVDVASNSVDGVDDYTQAEVWVVCDPGGPCDIGETGRAQDVINRDLTTGAQEKLDDDAQTPQTGEELATGTGIWPRCHEELTQCPQDTDSLSGDDGVGIACNDRGDCLTTWEQQENCNVITSATVTATADRDTSGGIDVTVYVRDPAAPDSFRRLFYEPNIDTGDVVEVVDFERWGLDDSQGDGDLEFCGGTSLIVLENDVSPLVPASPIDIQFDEVGTYEPMFPETYTSGTPSTDPLEGGDLDYILSADLFDTPVTFRELPASQDSAVSIELGIPWKQIDRIAAAMTGVVDRSIDTPGEVTSGGLSDVSFPGGLQVQSILNVADLEPVVTSDGTNFELTWIREFTIGRVVGGDYTRRTVVTQSFDDFGRPMAAERYVFQNSTSAIITVSDLGVTWTGDDYRATWTQCAGSACELRARSLGTPAPGVLITGEPVDAYDIADDPTSATSLLVYENNDGVFGQLVAGNEAVGGRQQLFAAGHIEPLVAFNPITTTWLVSAVNANPFKLDRVVQSLALDLQDEALHSEQFTPPFSGATREMTGAAIACPAPAAFPFVDLRFEDLPGASTLINSARTGNDAMIVAGGSPGIGVAGAPQAGGSDFGLRFDSPADAITVASPMADDLTLAFWYKADELGGAPFTIGTGTDGYELSIDNDTGIVTWRSGRTMSVDSTVNDGEWHFIAATRSADGGPVAGVGVLAVSIDGALVDVRFDTADLETADAATLTIVGSAGSATLDQFQVFPAALGEERLGQIFSRQENPRCVITTTAPLEAVVTGVSFTEPGTLATIERSATLNLTVDNDAPTSTVGAILDDAATSIDIAAQPGDTYLLSGHANDVAPNGAVGAGVAKVEVSVDGGEWIEAEGLGAWVVNVTVRHGSMSIRTRATDILGHVEVPGAPFILTVDGVDPEVTLTAPGNGLPVAPDTSADGQSTIALAGLVSDVGSGVAIDGVEVQVRATDSGPGADGWQTAVAVDGSWTIDYVLAASAEISGLYEINVRATDVAGNQTVGTSSTLGLDAVAPTAILSQRDARRDSIGDTVDIGGRVLDVEGGGIAGVDVAFTPIQAVLAVPDGTTPTDVADTFDWQPAVLGRSGVGVINTTWQFEIPADIENHFQMELRTTDVAGNQSVIANVWRGIIDTRAPRVSLSVEATGVTHRNGRRVEVTYRCEAEDLHLTESGFDCPGRTLERPVRTFSVDPLLETVFPDQTVLTGLESEYTRSERFDRRPASITVCDLFGNCTTQQAQPTGAAAEAQSKLEPGLNAAVVTPTRGQHVAAGDSIGVMVSGEADASIKAITLELDGTVVGERTFDRDAIVSHEEVLAVSITNEGTHNLVVSVEDWAGETAISAPVEFYLDTAAPALTLESTDVSLADTWAVGSDVYQFRGAVSDSGTIAAVQIKVGDEPWAEAFFDATSWHTAVRIPGADGTTVPIAVRAFDLAGRETAIDATSTIDLTPTDGPTPYVRAETQLVTEPDSTTTANFVFASIAGTNPAVAYRCQLDGRPAVSCTETWTVVDLAGGSHTLAVAATDNRGFADLTPVTYTWTVDAIGPQPTVASVPADPSPNGNAEFVFTVPSGGTVECSLDRATFETCTSPYSLSDLAVGVHDARLRVTVGGEAGSVWSYRWTVENASPTAADQSVFVTTNTDAGGAIELEATDADPLVYRVIDAPQHGFLEGDAPNLTYVPFPNYVGVDSFTFVADDGQSASALATVDVAVGTATTPTVAVTTAAGQDDPTNDDPVVFDVVFDQAVTGFDADDVRVAGSADVSTAEVTVSATADATTYVVNVAGIAGVGTLDVSVNADAASNMANQSNVASNVASLMFDAVGPVATIDGAVALLGDATPSSGLTIDASFSVTFDEAVSGFDLDDLVIGGTAGGSTATVLGSGTDYTVTVIGVDGVGTVTLDVVDGAVSDALGNPSTTVVRNGSVIVEEQPDLPSLGNGSLLLRQALLLILAGLVLLLLARRRRNGNLALATQAASRSSTSAS